MNLRALLAYIFFLCSFGMFTGGHPLALAAEPVEVPPVEHLDRLDSWTNGVAAADARERMLQIVCFGDSNTEGSAYVGALRRLLQGCYGERGIGYHSLGRRSAVPEAPKITHNGDWRFMRDAPNGPPPPRFALDGIWCETDDPKAEVSVGFVFGNWSSPANQLARAYNIQQRVRIHYQVGPNLGSFVVLNGLAELFRVACNAEKPGYAVTEAFLCDGFRIANVQGKAVLFGFDAERSYYLQGQPVLKGGALVHALGKSWGMAAEPAMVEDAAYATFFSVIRPDLITILFGTNDQHNDGRVHVYRENLTRMIRKLQGHSPGTGILVIACPEAGYTRQGLAVQFRDAAREVAAENGCAFWSLQDLVGPRSEVWTREGFFGDGLHYNAVGGGLLARMMLRQLGFDINDLRHYPVLRQTAAVRAAHPQFTVRRIGTSTLETFAAALAEDTPQTIWLNADKLAELRFAVAGDALAVHARVNDRQATGPQEAWSGGTFDLYIANPDNIARVMHNEEAPVVRQVVFHAKKPQDGPQVSVKQFTMNEKNEVIAWEAAGEFPYSITPLQPYGYELKALIPLSMLVLTPDTKEFLLECAAVAAAGPDAEPSYNRMFATRQDAGAFRDSSQSARVTQE